MASSAASDALSPGGRRVIVTGAEGGIGRATVATLERVQALRHSSHRPTIGKCEKRTS